MMPTQAILQLSKREALVTGVKGRPYRAVIKSGINIPKNPDTCFVEFIDSNPIISRFDNIEKTPLENYEPGTTTLEMFF